MLRIYVNFILVDVTIRVFKRTVVNLFNCRILINNLTMSTLKMATFSLDLQN